MRNGTFDFDVIEGQLIRQLISENREQILHYVREAYELHGQEQSINPDSYFLRFPEQPSDRIIALPAYLKGRFNVAGIKWIASFPGNIDQDIPRASASLILNRMDTGYPFACLEASQISAARTAASAVLGAYHLNDKSNQTKSIGFVGTGIIGRNVLEFFSSYDWQYESIRLFDKNVEYAKEFAKYAHQLTGREIIVEDCLEDLLRNSSVAVLTTTAPEPYIDDMTLLAHNPIVLNISLRDISANIIYNSNNVVDDIEHCMKANTSPHLAEIKYGSREFVNGTLYDVMNDNCVLDTDKPTIFSPFGLGVLDLAVGMQVYEAARESGKSVQIDNFFGEQSRW